MERQSYITRRFTEILKETISEKADELMGKLKFNPPGTSFDYVQEEGDPYSTEVKEKLVGGQKRLDKNKNNRIDSEDFAMLRKSKKKEMREYTMGDDAIEDVKPYDDITSTDSPKIRPGKKNQVKNVGFDYQKKVAKQFDDYELQEQGETNETETDESREFAYAARMAKKKGDKTFKLGDETFDVKESYITEKWKGDVDVKQTGEYSDMSIEELNAAIKKQKAKNDKTMESGKKVSHADKTKMSQLYFAKRAKQGWKGKGKAKVDETYYRIKVNGEMATFSENEMIDIIEGIVKEEKSSNIKRGKEPNGYAEYERAHKEDGKEADKYLKDLAKKMNNYIKDGSKQKKFDTNPKQFPKGNGELGEMDKKAYEIDQEGIDYNYEVGGLNIPDYDQIKPKKETIEKQIKGSSTNGNDQSYANAVNTGVNDKFAEYFEKDQLAKWKDESYGRVPSPVYDESPKSVGKNKGKLKEEFNRMQQLMGYSQKTQ
jgi:hypothetical protein